LAAYISIALKMGWGGIFERLVFADYHNSGTSLSANRTVVQAKPDFSHPRCFHDESAVVCGKFQHASREPQGKTIADQIGVCLLYFTVV
jgi:hypothetical protein